MTEHEVETLLDSGLRLGLRKTVNSPNYLGWILVSKHPPNPRLNRGFSDSEHAYLLREQREREVAPYLVLDIELKRSVHEAGEYEPEHDYRKKEKYWSKNVGEVQLVLDRLGVKLAELRESREVDAP